MHGADRVEHAGQLRIEKCFVCAQNLFVHFSETPASRLQTVFPQDATQTLFTHAPIEEPFEEESFQSDASYVYGRTWELYARERSLLFACYYQQINTTLTQDAQILDTTNT